MGSTTSAGTLRAGRVALAAGAGTGAVARGLGVQVPTRPEPLHMNITEATEPLIHHILPDLRQHFVRWSAGEVEFAVRTQPPFIVLVTQYTDSGGLQL